MVRLRTSRNTRHWRWLAAGPMLITLASGVIFALLTRPGSPIIAVSTVGHTPSAIAVDERSGHVFVVNNGDNSVSLLDARSGHLLRSITVGTFPDQVAVNPRTERAFVLNEGDATITVIDAVSGVVLDTLAIDPPEGGGPRLVQAGAAGPAGVANSTASALFVFESENMNDGPQGATSLGGPRQMVAVRDGPTGTQLQPISIPPPGWETAVDAATEQIFVPLSTQHSLNKWRMSEEPHVMILPSGTVPIAVAVDTQTGRLFVADRGQATKTIQPSGMVSVMDSRTGRLLRTIVVGSNPSLLAVDTPANRVLVLHGWGGPESDGLVNTGPGQGGGGTTRETDVLDARTGELLGRVQVGAIAADTLWMSVHPQLIAVDELRHRSFVMDSQPSDPREVTPGRVSLLDDRAARVLRSFAVSPFPVALAVDQVSDRLFVVNNFANCHVTVPSWNWVPASIRPWVPFLRTATPTSRVACAQVGNVTTYDLARLES